MAGPAVWVFFYGSYMNFDVLREVGLVPGASEVGRVAGFEVRISPRANLVRSDGGVVYGLLATATHDELSRLYAHARDVLGEVYLPEAVLVETLDGTWRAALCYLCADMRPQPADPAYVERIAGPARALGFPAWYIERLESFQAP
jgi:cation transport regulator ChaC